MTSAAVEESVGTGVVDPIRVLLVDCRHTTREIVLADTLMARRPMVGDRIEFYVEAHGVPTHLREEGGAWQYAVVERVHVRPQTTFITTVRP